MATSSNPATQVYLGWANSVLCEAGILLASLDDLTSGVALATIVDTLWPEAQLSSKVKDVEQQDDKECNTHNINITLGFLAQLGVTCNLYAQDAACGSEGALEELLWLVAFHLSICTPGAAPSDQTEEACVQDLLEWCLIMLPGVTVDVQEGLAANLCGENLLVHLISQFCPVEEDEDAVGLLMNAMISAEEYLGISKYILDPLGAVGGSAPERHLMLYLALLRRKSQQIEEMGPFASHLMGSQPEEETPWGAAEPSAQAQGNGGFPANADPQQFLDMLGQEPLTEEMLQKLQEQFGPIEIEIVEDSSEESGEPDVSQNNIEEEVIEVDDVESGSFNVWPQQPICYDSSATAGHIPLFMELEQAEEVERLSQEVSHARVHGPLDEDSEDEDNNFAILGATTPQGNNGEADSSQMETEDADSNSRQHLHPEATSKARTSHRSPSGGLKPPWLSPVPFSQAGSEDGAVNKSAENSMLMHSTPRTARDEELDDEEESYQNYNEEAMYADASREQYDDMDIDLESLTKDEIQELLISAQMEGIAFDPRLIDLAAAHGLEFEIVMEDEDGNIIEGFPPGEQMTSSNFVDLVQELRAASGQDMEMSLQYDSGVGTGTGLTTAGTSEGGTAPKVDLSAIQRQLQQHLGTTDQTANEVEYGGNLPNAPTTSLEDISGDEVLINSVKDANADTDDCRCPETSQDAAQNSRTRHNQRQQTTQHFHNSDQKPGQKKKYSSGQYFELLGEGAVFPGERLGVNGSGYPKDTTKGNDSDDNDSNTRQDSAKSSDGDSDNENGDRLRFSSNRSDRSFSSNTSVDGVIDMRADLDESEEEIVITMEVPGIPTEDGGFIIDMSKMFIPISIPGQGGDQEITVEIDPSNFDFSSMVQNADGTIEVDIEREVHNWMSKSASKFAQYSTAAPSYGTDNIVFSSSNNSSGTKTTGQYDNSDAEVNSAIRAAITEQLHYKSSSEDSRTGPTIRPLSETPPQHDSSGRVSGDSSSSLFDVSPAEDEVLQLLEQIGKHGQEMKKELQNSQQREICLYQEKSQDEVRLAATVTLLEKELHVVRSENKKLYKQINSGKTISQRDQGMIQRLESAMESLQTRLHTIQRDNTNLRKVNATLERRSRMVMHKHTMTETVESDHKVVQTSSSMFKLRTRGIQTLTVNKADFSMQQDGHHFMRNAITSTHDPIFRSLTSKAHGTQTDIKIIVDRGVAAMSTQEKLWFGSVSHASTQVRAVSKQHESLITRKPTRDASTITVTVEPERGISPIPKLNVSGLGETPKPDTKYPWHQSRNQEQQQRRTSTPIRANQPHRPVPLKYSQRQTATISTTSKTSTSQTVEKVFNQTQGESPAMENSATESMDTDEEPEGPDKWQRLSSTPMTTSDPTVIKLQRSLASATIENDLLQTKMKKAKDEMSTRLGEWADLLAASKVELNQAKNDAVDLANRHKKSTNLDNLHQKISVLEKTLLSAQNKNPRSEPNGSLKMAEDVPVKLSELETENSVLRGTLDKIKQERDQLVKMRGKVPPQTTRPKRDFTHLRQHHRHSTEAVTELESSLVGMTSERQNLQKEVQMLRDEYQHMKKGMEIMERYFSSDGPLGVDDMDKSTSTSSQAPSVVDDVVRESEAVLSVLKESDKVTQQSEAVLNALKDHDQDEVVVIPSGGVEGSLHKHISALAARIQSELGIKVQLVGEVDPAEILGASIHSQEGHTTSTPTPSQEDLTSTNAVEHLFQSVGPEAKPKPGVMDLQDVEDIIARAIPSPRDTSPSSPRGSVLHDNPKTGIESMDSAELRRKRLGMFVDSYTKPRASSPESRVSSPRAGRSLSPGNGTSRKTSPIARQEPMTVEDLEVSAVHGEPSTDHHMKMYRESRHQIKSQPPWASSHSQSRSNSPPKAQQESTQKPEPMRKKLTTSTPLLPSKFSMTSVGVSKSPNAVTEESPPPQQPSNAWAQPKWRPFSRLAKTARLKQEVRPPSRGPSRAEMAAEAESIQDDILSRYAGEMIPSETIRVKEPEPEPTVNRTSHRSPVTVNKPSIIAGISRTIDHSEVDAGSDRHQQSHRYDRSASTNVNILHTSHQPTPQKRQSYQKHAPSTTSQEPPVSRTASQTPVPQKPVFKDYDYTDYLLAKYGGDEDSTDNSPRSEHQSAAFSSSQENGEMSSSESDNIPQRAPRSSRLWANVHPPAEPRPTPAPRSTVPRSPRSSPRTHVSPPRQETSNYHTRQEDTASHRNNDLKSDYPARSEVNSRSNLSSGSRSAYSSSTSSQRPSSRPELYSRSNQRTDFSTTVHTDAPRTSTRPHSNPTMMSDTGPRSSSTSRTESPSRPWHTTSTSYTSYSNTEPPPTEPPSRSYYSEYLDNHETEDRYWTEPKPYDYRHSVSTAWKEPKRLDTWRDSDRLWPDASPSNSGHSTPASYSRPTSSRSAYATYTSSTTADHQPAAAPYQSMADRYRFSSLRTEAERDSGSTSGAGGYYPRSSSTTGAPSMYSHGYDRASSAPSTRSYVSRAEELTSVNDGHPGRTPLVSSTLSSDTYRTRGGSPAPATTSDFLLRPKAADDSFINGILDKYAGPSGTSSSSTLRDSYSSPGGVGHRAQVPYSPPGERPAPSAGLSHHSSAYDRYVSSYTPSAYDTYSPSTGTRLTTDSTSTRYKSATAADPYSVADPYSSSSRLVDPYSRASDLGGGYPAYNRYSSTTTTAPDTAGLRTRDRRAEIEELLNKYAPLH